MYDRQELHEKAIEYYKISAEKFEEVNALPNLAVVLENVAYTYSVLKDFENSKSYYLKAVDFYAKIGDSRNEMSD
jgi:tetratricopeptide (TPR) repeat protein